MSDAPPQILYRCPGCSALVEPIERDGYEHGPRPTAYAIYYYCPACGAEIDPDDVTEGKAP